MLPFLFQRADAVSAMNVAAVKMEGISGLQKWKCANMEELYPGLSGGGGFKVMGVARVSPDSNADCRPENIRELVAGFHAFGRRNFNVYGSDQYRPNPSFDLRPLTTRFLANAIENDPTFQFSVISERIGDVTYVSGAGARDYGGDIQQGMISLHAIGGWGVEGLRLTVRGELGDRSAFRGKPTPSEFKNASYALDLEIPWAALRFMFYDQMGFVLSNYKKFCMKPS